MLNKTLQILALMAVVCAVTILFTVPLPGQAPAAGQRGQAAPPPPPPTPLPTTGQGKLLMFADMALFAPRTPDNCILKSRRFREILKLRRRSSST